MGMGIELKDIAETYCDTETRSPSSALSHPLVGEGSTKIDCRKKSVLEDLGWFSFWFPFKPTKDENASSKKKQAQIKREEPPSWDGF